MKRVLVVDDEESVIKGLSGLLERLGWSVTGALSAEDGLERLKDGPYALVLLDVALPGMTGFQALERFAEKTQAPVILMSGHADEEFRRDALLLGAKELVSKPIDPAKLESLLEGLTT